MGEGKLYFYPENEQVDWIQSTDKGAPKVIVESDNLLNAKQIAAYILANRLYIFIRTAGGELNYTVSDKLNSFSLPSLMNNSDYHVNWEN